MITSQMSYEELANEVAKDYMDVSIIMRKKMPDALKYWHLDDTDTTNYYYKF